MLDCTFLSVGVIRKLRFHFRVLRALMLAGGLVRLWVCFLCFYVIMRAWRLYYHSLLYTEGYDSTYSTLNIF